MQEFFTMRTFLLMCSLLLLSFNSFAVVETFEFDDKGEKQQYQYLTETLRCPKCQNQNIADSNAPIATDMRREVHRLVSEGKTDDEVVDFMVDRFGEFVVYKPKLDASTLLLWFGPLVVGIAGVVLVVVMARKSAGKRNNESDKEIVLNEQEKEKIKNLLDD